MAALAGNYVNFGVFELYGDRALSDALDVALKMTLSIPLADILAFRKVCKILSAISSFEFPLQTVFHNSIVRRVCLISSKSFGKLAFEELELCALTS